MMNNSSSINVHPKHPRHPCGRCGKVAKHTGEFKENILECPDCGNWICHSCWIYANQGGQEARLCPLCTTGVVALEDRFKKGLIKVGVKK